MTIKKWQEKIHKWAKEKGHYDEERSPLERHALMHTEISEATEAVRDDNRKVLFTGKGKPDGEFVELADVVIRIMDYLEYNGVDLEHTIAIKMRYNETRPYRHGRKRIK